MVKKKTPGVYKTGHRAQNSICQEKHGFDWKKSKYNKIGCEVVHVGKNGKPDYTKPDYLVCSESCGKTGNNRDDPVTKTKSTAFTEQNVPTGI